MRERPLLLVLSLAASACIGAIGGDEPGGETSTNEETLCAAAPLPLARLTHAQYDRTVADLLALEGLSGSPSASFPNDDEVEGFAIGLSMSTLLVEKQQVAAEALAASAMLHPERIVPCATEDDACARTFIETFGARAFRRPLTPEEADNLFRVYQAAREDGSRPFSEGVGLVIEAVLVSPGFLYHWPTSEAADANGLVRIADYELASRLSYFVWGTMPDEALFAAAAEGRLRTADDAEREAIRMLDDPRAEAGVSEVFDALFDVSMVAGINRDQELFPDFSPEIARDLGTSLGMTLDSAFWTGGTFADLFTKNEMFVNGRLATFYGLDVAPGETFTAASLEGEGRSGILTHPALMARLGKFSETDPIHRGLFVWERVLCQEIAPPPPDVVFAVPTPAEEPAKTTRERYEMHLQPACASCHGVIDPLGFAFENYDALGRYRADENGASIDPSGTMSLDGEKPAFADGGALGRLAAESDDARRCWTEHWMRAAVRRGPADDDACHVEAIDELFVESGGNLRELVVRVVTSESFLTRAAPEGAAP
jgi:hypothetical protein